MYVITKNFKLVSSLFRFNSNIPEHTEDKNIPKAHFDEFIEGMAGIKGANRV